MSNRLSSLLDFSSLKNLGAFVFLLIFAVMGIFLLLINVSLTRQMASDLLNQQISLNAQTAAMTAYVIEQDTLAGADQALILDKVQASLTTQYRNFSELSTFVCLINTDGRVVSHPDPSMIGMDMSNAPFSPIGSDMQSNFGLRLAERVDGAGRLSEQEFGGSQHLIYQQAIPDQPWIVSVHTDENAILDRANSWGVEMFKARIPAGLVILVLGLFSIRFFASRFERSLAASNIQLKSQRDDLQELNAQFENEIAERMEAQSNLQNLSRFNRQILDSASDGILVFSLKMDKIIDANSQACEILEYSLDEIKTLSLKDIYPHDYQSLADFNNQVAERGGGWSDKLTWPTKTGREVSAETTASTFTDIDGEELIVVSFRDIRDRLKVESQLRQASKMEALGTLVGGIAHDFNNILGVISGHTELATMEIDNQDSLKRYLGGIDKGTERAQDLTRQLLSFARQNDRHQVLESVNIAELLEEISDLLLPTIPSNIQFTCNLESESAFIYADSSQIHQVVLNLCKNSISAIADHDGSLSISVSAKNPNNSSFTYSDEIRSATYVHIVVEDTGCGMSPEISAQIFDPFFTTKISNEGSGLGLSVAHGIVQSHRGVIEVNSEIGVGTRFNLYFPEIEAPKIESSSEKLDESPAEEIVGSGRILLVDDEANLTRVLTLGLEKYGFSVTAKVNSAEALESIESSSFDFDLLITDQNMPEYTGEDLVVAARRNHPNLKIILCTGYSKSMDRERAMSLGIDAFLLKPVSLRALASTAAELTSTTA